MCYDCTVITLWLYFKCLFLIPFFLFYFAFSYVIKSCSHVFLHAYWCEKHFSFYMDPERVRQRRWNLCASVSIQCHLLTYLLFANLTDKHHTVALHNRNSSFLWGKTTCLKSTPLRQSSDACSCQSNTEMTTAVTLLSRITAARMSVICRDGEQVSNLLHTAVNVHWSSVREPVCWPLCTVFHREYQQRGWKR